MGFKPGDSVVVEGQLATIDSYDEEANIVIFTTTPSGGGSDTRTAHISNTRIEALPAPGAHAVVDEPPAVEEAPAEKPAK